MWSLPEGGSCADRCSWHDLAMGSLWQKRWGIAGDVEELPEGSQEGLPDPNQFRIRPAEYEPTPDAQPASRRVTFEGLPPPAADAELAEMRPSGMPGFPCSATLVYTLHWAINCTTESHG